MERIFMKGNEAIAEAAIRSGCRFFSGYPITPQNEIPEYFARRMPEVDGIFLQGESEVASINMVIGSAFGGTRSMTSSSSAGVSLKSEGMSQAANQSLPLVITSVMRGGPGVGPITGSQQDYAQATKALGNGGYKMIVQLPESVQEAVDMTYEAFDLAEKYRNPVMVLIDGVIGVMMEPVALPEMKSDEEIAALKAKAKAEWAPGRRLDGRTNKLPTQGFEGVMERNTVAAEMYEGWKKDLCAWEEYMVDDAEIVIAAYGIAGRVAKSAIAELRAEGHKIGIIRPKRAYPFPDEPFEKLDPDKVKCILSVEMSIPAQMAEDVMMATGKKIPMEYCLTSGGVVMGKNRVLDKARALFAAL